MKSVTRHLNPDGLHRNPSFTQMVVISGRRKTIYVGGQSAVDEQGEIIGKQDLKAQTAQIFKNLQIALKASGATIENIIKWNIYVVQGQNPQAAFEVFQKIWNRKHHPPAITVLFVAGLANPDFLAEIDAIAIVPDE